MSYIKKNFLNILIWRPPRTKMKFEVQFIVCVFHTTFTLNPLSRFGDGSCARANNWQVRAQNAREGESTYDCLYQHCVASHVSAFRDKIAQESVARYFDVRVLQGVPFKMHPWLLHMTPSGTERRNDGNTEVCCSRIPMLQEPDSLAWVSREGDELQLSDRVFGGATRERAVYECN
jgi:hypothetical protein